MSYSIYNLVCLCIFVFSLYTGDTGFQMCSFVKQSDCLIELAP